MIEPPVKSGVELTDQQRFSWLPLIRSDHIGPVTFRELLNQFGTAEAALDALPELMARSGRRKNFHIASRDRIEREFDLAARNGARFIGLGEPDYPAALKMADGAPPIIAVKGPPECLTRHAVSIVGSRNSSLSGVKITRRIAGDLGEAGFVISSGLARGIDTAAHEAGLVSGTIAVFAGGLDIVYPTENEALLNRIIENGGAAISEMPFGWQPRAQDFPRRNRIVAGLSMGLVVVEAANRSGSLISARLANEMGRLVFAVPGSPLDPRCAGANKLLKQGAILTTGATDVLDALMPLTRTAGDQAPYSLEEQEKDDPPTQPAKESERDKIISTLGPTPCEIDEIIRYTSLSAAMVQLVLLELDLAGRLERHPGNLVSLV
ncbi:MAG: DNA-protecting protein DprA [Rhodobacteraceae bacterium]|nr:DNA-protecting protein DprA [Paracoccaceae bacterium]